MGGIVGAVENLSLCKVQLKMVDSYKNTKLLKEHNMLFFKYMKPYIQTALYLGHGHAYDFPNQTFKFWSMERLNGGSSDKEYRRKPAKKEEKQLFRSSV